MTERVRNASAGLPGPKMENDLLSPRKTLMVLVIVVGCFAVLWPKVFYPMLVGSASQHIKPSPIDKTSGCCDVISETDVNTIKIMSELCGTIIKPPEDRPLSGAEIVQRCRQEVLETCGIDISAVLQEQVRLGQSVKQILDEVRSLNGSLCLKYNFGVSPWRLGVPHRVMVKVASDASNIRQERPHHLRSELIHPAFRERGRAIPQPQAAPPTRPPPRVVEGRPGPIPGMRPTLGGAGHVVPPSKQGTSSMSVIMPIYTIGIVIFFTYTLMRIIFKKQPEGVGGSVYPPVEPDPHFRKEVFESEASRLGPRLTRENISSKLVVNAMSALLDEVDQEIEARRKSSEVASQDLVNGTLSNGDVVKPQDEEEQPTVKVLGMEMTASCEGGKKWSRPDSPVLPTSPPPPPAEPVPPPQEIYLEGALPAQSHLLVAESATEPEPLTGEDPAVVLSGKMTLSVISLDAENGSEEPVAEAIEEAIREENEPGLELEEYVLEPIILKKFEAAPASKVEIEDIEKKLRESSHSAVIAEAERELPKPPLIQLDSEETPQSVKVEELEKEVDELILEAIETIEHKQPISLDILQSLDLKTNEINAKIENEEKEEIRQEQPILQVSPGAVERDKIEVEEPKETIHQDQPPLQVLPEDVKKDISVTEEPKEQLHQEQTLQVLPDAAEKDTSVIEEPKEETHQEQPLQVSPDAVEKDTSVIEEPKEEMHQEPTLQVSPEAVTKDTLVTEEPKAEIKEEIHQALTENSLIEEPKAEIERVIDKVEASITEQKPEEEKSSTETISEKIEEARESSEDALKLGAAAVIEAIKEEISKKDIEEDSEEPISEVKKSKIEETPKSREPEIVDDDELGSEEEVVEEIEEIVYESDEEEESEEEEEESEEEIEVERNTNRTDSSAVQKVNGERSEDALEESKYTTVSGATAAENDISDEELTDNEEVDDEEEIIEIEEELDEDDEDYIVEEGNDINHVAEDSEPEL